MSLHLTSCVRADVSRSETIELADRIERGGLVLVAPPTELLKFPGRLPVMIEGIDRRTTETIVEALRAFV